MASAPTLTTRFLEGVAADPARDREYPDDKVSGLYFRLRKSGVKTWAYRYRRPDGSQGRSTLGSFPHLGLEAARRMAKEHGAAVANGRDPSREGQKERRDARRDRREKPQTLADLWERYEPAKADDKSPQTITYHRWLWAKHIGPRLGSQKLADLDRGTVRQELRDIAIRGKTQANNAQVLLAGVLNWAVGEDFMKANPIAGMPKLNKVESRDRVLSDPEIHALWAALEGVHARPDVPVSPRMVTALKLALLTGARGGEIIGLHANEIDRVSRSWTIPASRCKSGRDHVVPLSEAAVAVLCHAFKRDDDLEPKPIEEWQGFAFPSPADPTKPMERMSLTRSMQRIVEGHKIVRCTVHDLRRSVATYMASERIGVAPHVVTAVLGHKADGTAVTAIYNRHRYDKEKRAALEAWARLLREIVTAETRVTNVVALRAGG